MVVQGILGKEAVLGQDKDLQVPSVQQGSKQAAPCSPVEDNLGAGPGQGSPEQLGRCLHTVGAAHNSSLDWRTA